jgi:ribose 5-phosphate isomerase A
MSAQPENWHASPLLRWPREVKNFEAKLQVADTVAGKVTDGDVVGMGSGSAAYLTLWAIGRRVQTEGLHIRVIPSSYETEIAATSLNLPLARLGHAVPTLSVDGADEVDPAGRVLKGRGGAMFREKLLWSTSTRMFLAIDPSKHVERLGTRFPLPVEVHPNAVEHVAARLQEEGSQDVSIRTGTGKDGPVITESGFLVLDAEFPEIPFGLHDRIKAVPGVLETGLFEGFSYEIVE